MQEQWILIGRYLAVIVTSLLLGLLLGEMELFKKTAVVTGKLTAADAVRFLSYGGALAVFWLTVQRLTALLAQHGGRWSALQHMLLPLGALIVLSIAYSVALILLGPVMSAAVKAFYDWAFIIATLAAAVWLIVAMFNQSSAITSFLIGKFERRDSESAP